MRVLSHLCRTAVALAVLWTPAAARAQDIFIRVPVELGGTATRSTLPFSEPFLLVGAAPAQLRLVNARFEVLNENESPLTRDECKALLADPGTARQASAWMHDPQIKADSFSVLVTTGLRANRRYAFCMLTQSVLDSAALSGFQVRAYKILDAAYHNLDTDTGPPTAFPRERLDTLQLEIARALPRDQGEIETRNTIFDTTATGVKVTNENLIFTTGVLEAQRKRFDAAINLTEASDSARHHLARFTNDAALRAIAGTVTRRDRVPGMDSVAVERVAETARVLAFANPRLVLAAAGGETVLGPSAMLSMQPQDAVDITDVAEVARRASRVDSTYARIAELRDFTAYLGANAALRRRTGVTSAAAMRLRAQLDNVLTMFDGVRRHATAWASAHTDRHTLLVGAARSLRVKVHNEVPVVATTISDFVTRAKQYVTAELGVAYAPGMDEVVPYFGANFYLGALNKRVPLAVARPHELDRWSLTVGVAASSLARKNVRDDLFGNFSLLLGAGRRMADPLRLTGGAVVYRKLDVNPLVDHTTIAVSPFVSLSFDFDARSALGRLGETLFP